MLDKSVTLDGLSRDYSGMGDSKKMRQLGWVSRPVIRFGDYDYIILFQSWPRPGHNTAEVINVTQFNSPKNGEPAHFNIAVTKNNKIRGSVGNAWVRIDEHIGVLTIYDDGSLYEYANPVTAVLDYRIMPPTREDRQKTADHLEDQIDQFGLSRSVYG